MKTILSLTDKSLIEIAEIIDNNFTGNKKIIVDKDKSSVIRVYGHTDGLQCVNCDIKLIVDYAWNKIHKVLIQDDEPESSFGYRNVMPQTLISIETYLMQNDFSIEFDAILTANIDNSRIEEYVRNNCNYAKDGVFWTVGVKVTEEITLSVMDDTTLELTQKKMSNHISVNPFYKKQILNKILG